jgi:hypothetical protein
VARCGWRSRIKGSVALALGVVLVAGFIVSDRFSSWTDLGELAVLGLFAVCLARTAGPALRRDVAVAIDTAGIVLGGLGFWSARRELIPWPQITGVRVYEYSWYDSSSEPPGAIHHYPTVHIDRRDGQVTRTVVTGVRLDTQLLCEALSVFAAGIPVTVEGLVGSDPLARRDGVRGVLAPLLDFADRLRARRGHPPVPRSGISRQRPPRPGPPAR